MAFCQSLPRRRTPRGVLVGNNRAGQCLRRHRLHDIRRFREPFNLSERCSHPFSVFSKSVVGDQLLHHFSHLTRSYLSGMPADATAR